MEASPSLAVIANRCFSTVVTRQVICSAMPRLDRPSATRARILRSCGLSRSNGSLGRCRASSRLIRRPSTTISPAATLRIDSTSSSRSPTRSLRRYPTARTSSSIPSRRRAKESSA
ncbi:MAG TPA: hypothetical protein DEQ61_14520 [Streptomyces sp.]|nr:hypothetical protein [Streptomyces sp.]